MMKIIYGNIFFLIYRRQQVSIITITCAYYYTNRVPIQSIYNICQYNLMFELGVKKNPIRNRIERTAAVVLRLM